MKKLIRHAERFEGQSLGLDLHKRVMQYSVLNQIGDEVVNDRCEANRETLRAVVERLAAEGPLQVVLEATGCFMWAYDLLVELLGRDRVHVAAPSKVRVIAESGEKTDANDAWWLAYLLFEGRLPESFVAEGDLRELRIACREYRQITEERADLMRRFKSHLAQLGRSFASSDWASQVGWQRITKLLESVADEGVRAEALNGLWSRFKQLTEEQERWRARVLELSKVFDEIATVERTMPGLGTLLSSIVWSELGDPRRYARCKSYAKATGLTPGHRESAGRRRNQSITREGSAHVRWALTRAVVACMRSTRGPGLAIKQWVEARARRRSKKYAIVAAARKLAEGIWRLFHLGEEFDPARAFGG